jgi:hypothetical protein
LEAADVATRTDLLQLSFVLVLELAVDLGDLLLNFSEAPLLAVVQVAVYRLHGIGHAAHLLEQVLAMLLEPRLFVCSHFGTSPRGMGFARFRCCADGTLR